MQRPPYCDFHAEQLAELSGKLDEIRAEVKKLGDIDGPIGAIRERVGKVEASAKSAHCRLDKHERLVTDVSRQMNALAVKVGTIAAVLSTLATLILGRFS